MNIRYNLYLSSILSSLLGIIVLIDTMLFFKDLSYYWNIIANLSYSKTILAVIVIPISGFGLVLGTMMLIRDCNILFFKCSILQGAVLTVIQFLSIILPNASTCKCLSLSEIIVGIRDWSRLNGSVCLLLCGIIVYLLYRNFLYKKFKEKPL